MQEKEIIKAKFKALKACVLIPTYNNAKTLEAVISKTLEYCGEVMVVNDGATDSTPDIISKFKNLIVVTHPKNKGKGTALRNGFKKAVELCFDYVITIDSDGQHFPEDFITLVYERISFTGLPSTSTILSPTFKPDKTALEP